MKRLGWELNLASLRVGLSAEFINLKLWLQQAFLLPPSFSFSSTWLLVLVWLFPHHASSVLSRNVE